jgi:hypothetical protein
MTAPHEELEDARLRFVAAGKGDTRFYYLPEEVRKNLPDVAAAPSRYQIMEVVWALVARRLIYIDYSQPASSNWSIHATARGRAAAADSSLSPDNAPAYLKRVIQDVPELSDVPRFYLEEALEAYAGECFTASTMMLGVAAEAVFYDVAAPFSEWLGTDAGKTLAGILEKPAVAYVQKFTEFQKRLAASKGHLPGELQQNLDLNINSTLELLRLARNDAGHPTGIRVDRPSAFQYLVVFPSLAKRLYALKKHFESRHGPDAS